MSQRLFRRGTGPDNDLFRFFLIGSDHKTRWAFGAPGSPVRLHTTPGGLQGAPFEHDWQPLVGMDGELYRGTTDGRASISLQIWVQDPKSSAFARRQHSLWRESLGRGKDTCRLYVVSKESGYWWLDVRAEQISEANHFNGIPGRLGETGEQIRFTSDRSYWQRFDETRIFDRDTVRDARLLNLGDQPAWLKWVVTGDHEGVEIGVGDDTIFLPDTRTLVTDQELLDGVDPVHGYYIDTDPLWPSFMSTSGVDLQPRFPDVWWKKPLPPRGVQRGNSVALTVNPRNPGSTFRAEVQYTPRAEQAW